MKVNKKNSDDVTDNGDTLRYGISVCIAGGTGSGKTTLGGVLAAQIPNTKRIFTIESGSREISLVKQDADGKTVNSVVHTLTRNADNDKQSMDQYDLLEFALRFHPDIIIVGEMRSGEAYAAQESA